MAGSHPNMMLFQTLTFLQRNIGSPLLGNTEYNEEPDWTYCGIKIELLRKGREVLSGNKVNKSGSVITMY